ncbi:GM13163, partial [Drosophila sechellia]
PNFWRNVYPDPRTSCGLYKPLVTRDPDAKQSDRIEIGPDNHDTITMAAIDEASIWVPPPTDCATRCPDVLATARFPAPLPMRITKWAPL